MRTIARNAFVVLLTLTAVVILWEFRTILGVFVFSLFTAAAIRPFVEDLESRHVPRIVALLITYGLGLAILGAWFVVIAQLGADEIQELSDSFAETYETAYPTWQEGSTLLQGIAARLPAPQQLYDELAAGEGTGLAEGIIRITRSALAALAGIALIIVVSIYWTGDRVRFERLWLSFLQPQRRLLGRTVWRNVEDGVGDYLRDQFVQGTMVAGLLAIGYLAFGMSYPTLLATLGAFASLIPIVGVLFAVLPFAVAALGGNIPLAILSSTYTVAVFAGLKHYLLPRIFGRQRTNSGLLAVLFMVPLFEAYGLIGLAVAPPLAMAIETITVNIIGQFRPKDESVAEQGIAGLRSQLDSLQSRCETSGEELPMETANIFRRLSDLLAQAEQQLSRETSLEGD